MGTLLVQLFHPDGTKDGGPIPLDKKIFSFSEVLMRMEAWSKNEGGNNPATLHQVNKCTFIKVLKWIEHHQDDASPQPVTESEDSNDISSWDKAFMDVADDHILDILLAADYLFIPGLFRLAAKTVANKMKEKTTAELRDYLGYQNDLSPEEEQQIRKRDKWMGDVFEQDF